MTALDVSVDGRVVASADEAGVLRVWDAASGRCVAAADTGFARADAVSISPDGTLVLATSTKESCVRVWRASDALQVASLDFPVWDVELPAVVGGTVRYDHLRGEAFGAVECASWLPGPPRVLVLRRGGGAEVWSVESQRRTAAVPGTDGVVRAHVTADGSRLLVFDPQGIGVLSVPDGRRLWSVPRPITAASEMLRTCGADGLALETTSDVLRGLRSVLTARSMADGRTAWVQDLGTTCFESEVVPCAGDVHVVTSDRWRSYAAATGELLCEASWNLPVPRAAVVGADASTLWFASGGTLYRRTLTPSQPRPRAWWRRFGGR